MTESTTPYDFIIVGGGPAGCSIASLLAKSAAKPSVLLLEAGGDNSDVSARIGANRLIQIMNPTLTYPYESVPQKHLGDRKLKLERGKGLGGSSAVNFTLWDTGARDDWDMMACLTGDETWQWQLVQQRFKSLENFHGAVPENVPAGMAQYVDPKPENHGYDGPLHTGMSKTWDPYFLPALRAWESMDYNISQDPNDGSRLGIAVFPTTAYRGTRSTAADLLAKAPSNLQIITDAVAHRVVFEGNRASGILLLDGRVFYATREVILAAGSLDSPKILMHSGIGPGSQLQKFNIPLLYENQARWPELRGSLPRYPSVCAG